MLVPRHQCRGPQQHLRSGHSPLMPIDAVPISHCTCAHLYLTSVLQPTLRAAPQEEEESFISLTSLIIAVSHTRRLTVTGASCIPTIPFRRLARNAPVDLLFLDLCRSPKLRDHQRCFGVGEVAQVEFGPVRSVEFRGHDWRCSNPPMTMLQGGAAGLLQQQQVVVQLLQSRSSYLGLQLGPQSGVAALPRTCSLNLRCQVSPSSTTLPQFNVDISGVDKPLRSVERTAIRLALPSKGRMAEDSLGLMKDCELSVRKLNPRQYIADISELKNVEVWFQRASDVVRKLKTGDVDLGIVGCDMLREYGEDSEDLIVVHDALKFGQCHLAIGIPSYGIFENINSLSELAAMPLWTEDRPLRVVTGYTYLGKKFLDKHGFKHVQLSTADGALEAAPAMGTADCILDLVSSGTTLRENNLKEINGGAVLSSQGVFVANKKALLERKEVLDVAHEMLERFEAHLTASGQFTVVANMRGDCAEEVADRILNITSYSGLQGPTVSPVYTKEGGKTEVDYYAITICVPKSQLYHAVRQLRKAGGSGVLVSPLTYIFDEETPRYRQLLENLNA